MFGLSYLLLFIVIASLLVMAFWFFFSTPCSCHKTKLLLGLHPVHPKMRYFIIEGVLFAGGALVCFLDGGSGWFLGIVLWGSMSIREFLAVWYHEKDKIKRAMKAFGRVIVLPNMRLGVTHA